MTNAKKFTTFDQQVERLKSRGLIFHSEDNGIKALRQFGYYNIINGYKEHYIEVDDGKEKYKDGVSFEQIFSLYRLDRTIRSTIMAAMLEIEDNLKTAMAHVIAETFSSKEELYLLKKNFNLGKKREGKYQLDDIFNKFEKIKNDNSQPFKHYRDNYNNIPPWILFKGASFGNMVNFLKLQKADMKNKVISLIYGFPVTLIQEFPELKSLFMDTIFMCLEYRNIAAHGGRTYNYIPKSSFRYNPLLHSKADISEADYRRGKGKHGIPILLTALSYFDNSTMVLNLKCELIFFTKKHCDKYPMDTDYLSEFIPIS